MRVYTGMLRSFINSIYFKADYRTLYEAEYVTLENKTGTSKVKNVSPAAEVSTCSMVIAYGVPALIILGGIVILLLSYPRNLPSMVSSGLELVILGSLVYGAELVSLYYGDSLHQNRNQSAQVVVTGNTLAVKKEYRA